MLMHDERQNKITILKYEGSLWFAIGSIWFKTVWFGSNGLIIVQ